MNKQIFIAMALVLMATLAVVSAQSILRDNHGLPYSGGVAAVGMSTPSFAQDICVSGGVLITDLETAAIAPTTGGTCTQGGSYCENRSCGGREKTCVCTTSGGATTCIWSDWQGCGRGISCDSDGMGGSCPS